MEINELAWKLPRVLLSELNKTFYRYKVMDMVGYYLFFICLS